MALAFLSKPIATVKADLSTGNGQISIPGITTASTTPANLVTQINKLLNVAGKSIVANVNMTRTQQEEVVDNG